MRDECGHGSLRRSCPICEAGAEILRLQSALAESEARRAEAERRLEDERQKCRLHIDYRALDAVLKEHREPNTLREPSARVKDRLEAYQRRAAAALQRAESAERSLAAAIEVLHRVQWDDDLCCIDCGGEKHRPGCALAALISGGGR